MIGVDDNTFISGSLSPVILGFPVLLFKGRKSVPSYVAPVVFGSTFVSLALLQSDLVKEMSAPISRALTWRN